MELLINQLYTFVVMFVFGIFLGLGFDIYRAISRKINRVSNFLFNISDLIFGLAAGCIGFFVLLGVNWGEFRFYILIAIIAGMLLYIYIKGVMSRQE